MDKYICPKCRQGRLIYTAMNESDPFENKIICQSCQGVYPVLNDIPRFVSKDNYASSFGFQWNMHRKTQLDSYTGLSITGERLFETTNWPTQMQGSTILEAGCGAGRFTEILLNTGATVFAFDYSSSVEANWENNRNYPNLILFQGDIYNIPLKHYSFDKVLCLGVIQHTPEPEKAFKCLCQHVRPGGEIVIDTYSKRLFSLISWKYVLRPLAKRIRKDTLYNWIEKIVTLFLPYAFTFAHIHHTVAKRLLPIACYPELSLEYELSRQWSILDTFDMYAPVYDHPQTLPVVSRWFREAGLQNIVVRYGPNGIIAKGTRPHLNDNLLSQKNQFS